MAYNHVHHNMPDALPCLCAVQRNLHTEYNPLSEGNFRFEKLVNYLKKNDVPFIVAISENATQVLSRVEYNNTTNRLVGFGLPCKSEGLLLADSFLATSLDVIESCFMSKEVSKYVYVYMAQCIATQCLSILLGSCR